MAFSIAVGGPAWFLGTDMAFEGVAIVVALLISIASFQVFKWTKEKKYRTMSIAFFLLFLAFVIKEATNWAIVQASNMGTLPLAEDLVSLSGKLMFGYTSYIALFLIAYLMLLWLSQPVQSKQAIILLALVITAAIFFSASFYFTFHTISTLLLVFVTLHFWQNYSKRKSASSLMVFAAFALLALSHLQFFLQWSTAMLYVTAHITELLGYLLLFFALLKVLFR